MPAKARRGSQSLWGGRYRDCEQPDEGESASLEEQQVPLAAAPTLTTWAPVCVTALLTWALSSLSLLSSSTQCVPISKPLRAVPRAQVRLSPGVFSISKTRWGGNCQVVYPESWPRLQGPCPVSMPGSQQGPSLAWAPYCPAPDPAGPLRRPCLLNHQQALQDETSTGRKCVDSWCRRVRLPCRGMPWPSSARNMGRPRCLQRREAYVL